MNPPDAAPSVVHSRTRTARLIGNTASLVTNDLVNRAITFVLYALIARYLGAYEFGQMSITLIIFYLLQSLAPMGLKMLLVRETARNPQNSGAYLVQGSLVSLAASILAIWLVFGFLSIMNYAEDTTWIIMLISFGLIPYSLSAVCEAIFQAHEQIRWITLANVPVSLLRGLAAFWMLSAGLDLRWIGILFLVTFTITWLLEWILLTRHIAPPNWSGPPALFVQIARMAVPFIGLQGIIAITNSILPLFLSKSSGEVQVGLFNAANQIMAPVLLVSQSVVVSLFPRLCQKYDTGQHALRQTTDRLTELLFAVTVPAVIGLIFYARFVLLLIYDKEIFAISALLLQVMACSLLFRAITSVLGRVLMASGRERTLLRILIIETILYTHPSLGCAGRSPCRSDCHVLRSCPSPAANFQAAWRAFTRAFGLEGHQCQPCTDHLACLCYGRPIEPLAGHSGFAVSLSGRLADPGALRVRRLAAPA